MPYDPVTNTFTRVVNSFSTPSLGTEISPTDADDLFDDYDQGITDIASSAAFDALLGDTPNLFAVRGATVWEQRAIVGSDLPNPSTVTLGGVFSLPVASNSVLSGIANDGTPTRATTTGTGDVVRATSPTIATSLGVSGPLTVTSNSSSALAVGRLGATTPALQVSASIASSITGLSVISQASGNGVNLTAIGETNVPIIINAAGSGGLNFQTTGTGGISFFRDAFILHDSTPTFTLGIVGGTVAHITTPGTSGLAFTTNSSVDQVKITHTASANRQITLTGSNGGNPTIATTAGSLAITPAVVGAAAINGLMAANTFKGNNTGSSAQSVDLTIAQSQAALQQSFVVATGVVSLNAAGDSPVSGITFALPTGFTRYRIGFILLSGASTNISAGTIGLFTAAGGAGTAIVTAATAITITSNAEDTNNNMQLLTANNQNTQSHNQLTLFPRVAGTVAGATVTISINIQPES